MIIIRNKNFQISINHIDILRPIEDYGPRSLFHLDFNSRNNAVAFKGPLEAFNVLYKMLHTAQSSSIYHKLDGQETNIILTISNEIKIEFCKY